jgi:PAS domain S-box-containing protein
LAGKKKIAASQNSLRTRAEKALSRTDVTLPESGEKNQQKILHELQVYRVELEMQNDELRRTQQQLEESRNRYTDLYDYAPVGYFSLSPKGEITMLNVTGAQLLGYSRSRLLGTMFANYVEEKSRDTFYFFKNHVLNTTKSQTCDLKLISHGEVTFFAHLEGVQVEDAESGRKTFRIAVLDITERKIAQQRLQESEENLREAHELAGLASWTYYFATKAIVCSPELYKILGLRRQERLDGRNVLRFIHPEDFPLLQRHVIELEADKNPLSLEFRIVRKDGTARWVYCRIKAQADMDGKVTRFSGFIQDITEKKEALELHIEAERLAATAALSNMITHEVRNPLTSMMLSIDLLKKQIEKKGMTDIANYVDVLDRNSRRIDKLITYLLYSSKNTPAEPVAVQITALLDNMLLEAGDRIALAGATLYKQYYSHCTLTLDHDSVKLAFLSIVINAVEALEQDKGIITVTTESHRDKCRITIRDNGKGISPEHLEKIFEPFFTTKSSGMGLGLTNVKTIIEMNSGEISVESEVGLGTSFIVEFPLGE